MSGDRNVIERCPDHSEPSKTIIEYMYRDAGNYKFYGSFCLEGILTKDEVEPHLLHREYFLPNAIGLGSLVPEQMNSDDHPLHEFIDFRLSNQGSPLMSKGEFVNRLKAAQGNGWFGDNRSSASALLK